jgi:hypothetical protein
MNTDGRILKIEEAKSVAENYLRGWIETTRRVVAENSI